MKPINLSQNLYLLRKKHGLSQEEFAEKIHISRQAVSKWERGEAYPDTENLIAIASFYGVTLDELVISSSTFDLEINESACDDHGEADDSDSEYDSGEAAKPGITIKGNIHFDWHELPYTIIVTVAYLLLGFLTPNGFGIWWTLFVTIPIYYSVVECIRKKSLSPFAYPVFAAFIFLLVGMLTGIWHPTWVIFVTTPIYYAIVGAIDRRHK